MYVNNVSFWLYFSFVTNMDSAGSTAHTNLIKKYHISQNYCPGCKFLEQHLIEENYNYLDPTVLCCDDSVL